MNSWFDDSFGTCISIKELMEHIDTIERVPSKQSEKWHTLKNMLRDEMIKNKEVIE